jgi:hypothetical protein
MHEKDAHFSYEQLQPLTLNELSQFGYVPPKAAIEEAANPPKK